MNLVLIADFSLGAIGAISAVILYFVAQKFKVYEDPRNGQVEEVLPELTAEDADTPDVKVSLMLASKLSHWTNFYAP